MAGAHDPYKFEREVAELFRQLGADARHDVAIAGNQIDVVVLETVVGGGSIVRIVECKAYSHPVGIDQVGARAARCRLDTALTV